MRQSAGTPPRSCSDPTPSKSSTAPRAHISSVLKQEGSAARSNRRAAEKEASVPAPRKEARNRFVAGLNWIADAADRAVVNALWAEEEKPTNGRDKQGRHAQNGVKGRDAKGDKAAGAKRTSTGDGLPASEGLLQEEPAVTPVFSPTPSVPRLDLGALGGGSPQLTVPATYGQTPVAANVSIENSNGEILEPAQVDDLVLEPAPRGTGVTPRAEAPLSRSDRTFGSRAMKGTAYCTDSPLSLKPAPRPARDMRTPPGGAAGDAGLDVDDCGEDFHDAPAQPRAEIGGTEGVEAPECQHVKTPRRDAQESQTRPHTPPLEERAVHTALVDQASKEADLHSRETTASSILSQALELQRLCEAPPGSFASALPAREATPPAEAFASASARQATPEDVSSSEVHELQRPEVSPAYELQRPEVTPEVVLSEPLKTAKEAVPEDVVPAEYIISNINGDASIKAEAGPGSEDVSAPCQATPEAAEAPVEAPSPTAASPAVGAEEQMRQKLEERRARVEVTADVVEEASNSAAQADKGKEADLDGKLPKTECKTGSPAKSKQDWRYFAQKKLQAQEPKSSVAANSSPQNSAESPVAASGGNVQNLRALWGAKGSGVEGSSTEVAHEEGE